MSSFDWSGRRIQKFGFWSQGEIARVCAILGIAVIPLSMEAADPHPRATTAEIVAPQPGRLRVVRITPFDPSRHALAAMGDEPVR
jgi:hypothetical protein